MRARTESTASMCAYLALAVTETACKGPPSQVSRAKPVAPPATVAGPVDVRKPDAPAGDSATFGGREYLSGDTLFSFADYHTAAADIEHPTLASDDARTRVTAGSSSGLASPQKPSTAAYHLWASSRCPAAAAKSARINIIRGQNAPPWVTTTPLMKSLVMFIRHC